MDAAQRLTADEPLQCLDAERELTKGERPLPAHAARSEALQVLRRGVLRAVDNPQVLAAAALDRRLHQSAAAAGDELYGLHHHAFATPFRQLLPPADAVRDARRVRH